jgi:hypothetical protein
MNHKQLLFLIVLTSYCLVCYSQDSAPLDNLSGYPRKLFEKVSKKAVGLKAGLHRQTAKYLKKLSKHERRLNRKFGKSDSASILQFQAEARGKYDELLRKLNNPQGPGDYFPFTDTLKTTLNFIASGAQTEIIPANLRGSLQSAMGDINGMEAELKKAELVRQFIRDRKTFLQQQFGKAAFSRQLRNISKDAYYYQQTISEYKNALQDPQKIERKAIDILSKTKIFQEFMRRHSFLASLFNLPSEPGSPAFQANLAGLQTRAQVNQLVQQQFAGGNPSLMVQQNISNAQEHLQLIKDKVNQLGNSGDPDAEIPNFKPNKQKTKTFLQRLELGTNIQTQKATSYFPATSDIGLSLGYKLNDKSIAGIGMAYAVGLGSGWRDIQFSSQGLGIRSFLDWRLKGSFWVTGGYEMNYRSAFHDVNQLKSLNAWQRSGLVGIAKVISLKTKMFSKTKVSLLYDFLSYQQVPQTPALKFRIGYNFK